MWSRAISDGGYGGADEPTVQGTPISKYPLEVVDERGREFAIVLRSQPTARHIAVAADDGHDARLEGTSSNPTQTRATVRVAR